MKLSQRKLAHRRSQSKLLQQFNSLILLQIVSRQGQIQTSQLHRVDEIAYFTNIKIFFIGNLQGELFHLSNSLATLFEKGDKDRQICCSQVKRQLSQLFQIFHSRSNHSPSLFLNCSIFIINSQRMQIFTFLNEFLDRLSLFSISLWYFYHQLLDLIQLGFLFHEISQIKYSITRELLQSIHSLLQLQFLFNYPSQILRKDQSFFRKLFTTMRSFFNLISFMLSFLLAITTPNTFIVSTQQMIFAIQSRKVTKHHFCGLVITIMRKHAIYFSKQVWKQCQLYGLAALFNLLLQLAQNIHAIIDIDQTYFPLAFNLLMLFLYRTPLLKRPLNQFWHDSVYFNQLAGTITRMTIWTGRHTIMSAFTIQAG